MKNGLSDRQLEYAKNGATSDVDIIFGFDNIKEQLCVIEGLKDYSSNICNMFDDIDILKLDEEQRLCRTTFMPVFINNEKNIDYIIDVINSYKKSNLKDIDKEISKYSSISLYSSLITTVTNINICTFIMRDIFNPDQRYDTKI